MRERRRRSVAKALTWRVLATLTTITLVFIATGSIRLSAGVGVFDVLIKLILYYFHERVWNRVHWAKEVR